jgi:hypothetical protein
MWHGVRHVQRPRERGQRGLDVTVLAWLDVAFTNSTLSSSGRTVCTLLSVTATSTLVCHGQL